MEGMTMTYTITAALASSARGEDDMLRRDFLKTATATAVLTAILPVQIWGIGGQGGRPQKQKAGILVPGLQFTNWLRGSDLN
jgi:hypothetical protein